MPSDRPSALVTPVVVHDGNAYLSGQLPRVDGHLVHQGRVGETVDLETACIAAELATEAVLEVIRTELGDRFERILKITGFVASASDFTQQGTVVDAASRVLVRTLGTAGEHARSAIGVAQLPHGACFEIEVVAAVHRR